MSSSHCGLNYLNVDILPFGNARMHVVNGTVTFDCQHGPDECYINEVQTCAVKRGRKENCSTLRASFLSLKPPKICKKAGSYYCAA
ncbi:hypothetical protein MRX96_031799 [Rhipicephalus microplus]